MIHSKLGSSTSTQDFEEDTQLMNRNCMKMMMGMELPMLRNVMMFHAKEYDDEPPPIT